MGLLTKLLNPLADKRPPSRVGLQLSPDHIQMVSLRYHGQQKPCLERYERLNSTKHPKQALLDAVKKYRLNQCPTTLLLTPQTYQLFSIPAPDLPREEWQEAMQWQIQDHIDDPASEMVVAFFETPPAAPVQTDDQQGSLYVAAARETMLRKQSLLIHRCGLDLTTITIPEMALTALTNPLPEQSTGFALLQLDEEGGLLLIIRQQMLYLARRLFNRPLSRSAAKHRYSSFSQEEILLEIRRTLDFFEGNFNLPAVSVLYLMPMTQPYANLHELMDGQLKLSVKLLDIRQQIHLSPGLSNQDLTAALPLIGAALSGVSSWQHPSGERG